MLYPSLVIAILAAIVASQTMITATFQVRNLWPGDFVKVTVQFAEYGIVAISNH